MQKLRVETAALQATATRWCASASGLPEAMAPVGLGSSPQPSAVAVNAAHADIGVFTAALATQVDMRSRHVADADTRYLASEAQSAYELAAVADSVSVV